MIETLPRLVSFHVKVKTKENRMKDKEEEDGCFLSVLLFNYRNNGRFPFQLIILLVSRPHSTRTGRQSYCWNCLEIHMVYWLRQKMSISYCYFDCYGNAFILHHRQ